MSSSVTGRLPPIVHEVLRSPGKPLDSLVRGFMEAGFDHDFSSVRIHSDAKAAKSARAIKFIGAIQITGKF